MIPNHVQRQLRPWLPLIIALEIIGCILLGILVYLFLTNPS